MGSLSSETVESPPAPVRLVLVAVVASFVLLFCGRCASAQNGPETRLFSQGAQANLDRNFPDANISYLLMDATGQVIAERWTPPANSEHAVVYPGSLVKPFLAIAYGEQHGGVFPTVRCLGAKTHCWLPAGHGSLGLEEAVAQSCNAYFLEIAAHLERKRAQQTLLHYGLLGPASGASNENLIGLGTGWRESPLALARAYIELERQHHNATQSRIVKGMLESAARGTAREVDAALGDDAALAKTGTAVCSHTPQGVADGFTVVLYPAMQPRLLLLLRIHGVTGAKSARVAGAMLRSLGAGRR